MTTMSMQNQQEKIYRELLDVLEVIHVKDGGGDSTAIGLSYTEQDYPQDNEDLEREAYILAERIVRSIHTEDE